MTSPEAAPRGPHSHILIDMAALADGSWSTSSVEEIIAEHYPVGCMVPGVTATVPLDDRR